MTPAPGPGGAAGEPGAIGASAPLAASGTPRALVEAGAVGPSAPVAAPGAPGALVEAATWVPASVEEVDGWRLGFSGGFTRRANSVLPLGDPPDLARTLDRAESRYAAAGLPTVVRLCSVAPAALAQELADRGYATVAATDVLVRDLAAPAAVPPHPGVRVVEADRPDDAWLAGWLAVKAGAAPVDHDLARRVVTGSPARYLTALDAAGAVLGVLRTGFAGEWAGLGCLVVAPAARRRGLGRVLTRAALAGAARAGARRAFLQVEVANTAAARLYADEGFLPAERYVYRQR